MRWKSTLSWSTSQLIFNSNDTLQRLRPKVMECSFSVVQPLNNYVEFWLSVHPQKSWDSLLTPGKQIGWLEAALCRWYWNVTFSFSRLEKFPSSLVRGVRMTHVYFIEAKEAKLTEKSIIHTHTNACEYVSLTSYKGYVWKFTPITRQSWVPLLPQML